MADPLAALLLQDGTLSAEALAQAHARQAELGGGLDTALLELGLLREEALIGALTKASGLGGVPREALAAPDARARRVFPSKVAERHRLAPFRLEGRDLAVAAAWPVDVAALDEIGFMLSLQVVPFVAPEWRVLELRQRVYGIAMPVRYAELAERMAREGEEGEGSPIPEAPPASAATPAERAGEPESLSPAPAGERARADDATAWREGEGAYPTPIEIEDPPQAEPVAGRASEELQPPDPAPPPAPPPGMKEVEPEAAEVAGPSLELRGQPPRWSLPEARDALAAAASRDDVVAVALHYARDFFDAAAVLAVARERLRGHDALGADPMLRARVRGIEVPIGLAGIVRSVLEAGGPYLGPPAPDPALDAILDGLARAVPHTVLLYPVVVRERVAALLYADNGEAPVSPRRVGDLLMLAASLGAALERILVTAKRAGPAAPPASPPPEAWEAREPALAPGAPPQPPPPPEAGLDLSAPEEHYQVAPAAEALAAALAFEPEAGVARLVETARGSAERGRLVALLVQHGPEAAASLAQAFPGPIDPRIAAQEEGLAAGERGPVLMAMAALGIVSTPWLAVLLADPDPRRRRYAALLLAQIGDPAGFLPLCDRIFDPDPQVAETALAALGEHRRHPDFGPVLERLRRSLASEAPRPARAARALMALGDAGAVPALAALLDGTPESAAAAAEALEALTARRFGRDAAAWSAWWRAHRGAARADWLFEALRDPDREVRIAAAEALRAVGPSPVRYFADAPEAERERAAAEWRAWFEQSGLAA